MSSRPLSRRPARLVLTSTLIAGLGTLGLATASTPSGAATAPTAHTTTVHTATAHTATAHTTSGNPLAGPWGVYKATTLDNPTYRAYASATGTTKRLLGRVALRPRAQWFGAWITNDRIGAVITRYIADVQSHNKNAIAMMTMFPIPKWETGPQSARKWSAAEIASYKTWINNAAKAIGSNRAMVVEQPDLIYATKNDHPSVPLGMIRYAAQKFGSLPHTTVYLDAGSRDYKPSKGVSMVTTLKSAGIGYTRGFSLNDTHHDSTNLEIGYGNTLSKALAKAHLPYHFVVNTASNGTPSTGGQLSTDKDAPACANRTQKLCLALGIPPTYQTAAAYWGITATNKKIAQRLVDGYVWVDRPWLYDQDGNQSAPTSRAVNLGKATPYIAATTSPATATSYGTLRKGAAAVRKTFAIKNTSTKQNMTIDGAYFTNVVGGTWSYSTASTCKTGVFVAPGRSCTAIIVLTPTKAGKASAYLHFATNTATEAYRKVSATIS